MRVVEAVPAGAAVLSGLAEVVDLRSAGPGVVSSAGAGWTDAYSAAAVLEGPAHIGRTVGPSAAEPVAAMERHDMTREVVVGTDGPLVLPLCSGAVARPTAEAVVAVVIEPGQCLSLHPGTWHAPAMGLDGPCTYLWLAGVDEHASSGWVAVDGGPVILDSSRVSRRG